VRVSGKRHGCFPDTCTGSPHAGLVVTSLLEGEK